MELISISELLERKPARTYLQLLEVAKAYKVYATVLEEKPRRVSDLPKGVLWQGRQWKVTKTAVECTENGREYYFITHDRLWEGEKDYGWVRHMIMKYWVDIGDFAEALRVARRMKAGLPISEKPNQGEKHG